LDQDIRAAIELYQKALEAFGIHVHNVILYGSQVDGSAKEHSDIDVVVVSDDFEGMNVVERLEGIGTAAAHAGITEPIEALAYTVAEYEAMGPGTFVGQEVKPKGIVVT